MTQRAAEALEQASHFVEGVQIGEHTLLDVRTLHLDSHLAAIAQHRAMHLGE